MPSMHFHLNSGKASPVSMLFVGQDFLHVSQNKHSFLLKMIFPSTFFRMAATVFFLGSFLCFMKNLLELFSRSGSRLRLFLYACTTMAANSSALARSMSLGRPSLIFSQILWG